MKNAHKCRYCANANLFDCNFEIKDMNKDCVIYCDVKNQLKENINKQNKCDSFVFNPICVVTGQEVMQEKIENKRKYKQLKLEVEE